MCGKRRRQRQAEAAALSAAVATLSNQARPSNQHMVSALPQARGIIPSIPQENPPPYTYPEKQPTFDKKEVLVEPSYDTVAQEWLSAADRQGRKPSFNSYHSFDARAAPAAVQNPRGPVGTPMQGSQSIAPAAGGGLLGWLLQRQQKRQRRGCCGRRRGHC